MIVTFSEDKTTVTMTSEEYGELIKDQAKLEALEAGGVDNWDYYDDSLEEWREQYCN